LTTCPTRRSSDLFHDLFGHVPLLMNPVFADYMQAYGRGVVKARGIGPEALQNLTRLYWYTVEFGLIREAGALRIYGAGIVSSSGESVYALESAAPNRIGFDLERIMRTRYRIRSEEHTSELQSRENLVCRLLLEKKKRLLIIIRP